MKVAKIIKIYNKYPGETGFDKLDFILNYNKSLLEPVIKQLVQVKKLETITDIDIPLSFIHLSIEDIPDDLNINTEELETIFEFIK